VQLDELARDRQPEPRPVVPPRGRRVDLRELAEDQLVVLGRDPDPGVDHLDEQRLARPGRRRRAHRHAAAARGAREVDGVAEQVAEHVRQLLAVGRDRRQVGRQVGGEHHVARRGERAVEREHLLDHRGERERGHRQRELVGRAARVGEDLAHHLQQVVAALDDPVDARPLPVAERAEHPVAEDLGVRDDGRERRAQVVRDVREELRLQPVARLQLGDEAPRLAGLRLERREARLERVDAGVARGRRGRPGRRHDGLER
jgi:hypothetical protein